MPSAVPAPSRPWVCRSPEPALIRHLAQELQVEHLVASALANRGVTSPDEGRDFLDPKVEHLHDPFLLADMERAAERLARAIRERESIVVYGDYDVDGLTSTALMVQFLRYLGAQPAVYVPNRATEGYSFTTGGVAHCLSAAARVVVSVDNGIASNEPVAELAAAGVDVIITDHHLPGAELPPAFAIVNPRRADCDYPYKGLAGVGVAFKLACAVANRLTEGKRRSPEVARFLGEAMAWVALGTVADMMPLTGENRVLAARGLPAIPRSTSPGLAALCRVAGVTAEEFSAEDVAFKLAPRINAAGRLGRADIPLALLIAPDEASARPLAEELDRLNRKRREADRDMLVQAQALLARQPSDGPIVLHQDDWPSGLLGLVAGRLVQQTGRPAVLISGRTAEESKGSGRSGEGFDLHAALQACREHLLSWGGHARAAGFSIRPAAVPAFCEALRAAWQAQVGPGRPVAPLEYDGELPLAAVTQRLVSQLER
ncbi:MAG: single-stranded-DNA-specific exonuclease RecJ, partial [Planctomycetes bacterium]|nr:single-stranded-DNA-specific exonuclease RecJ [Planctomycetota bacterium]